MRIEVDGEIKAASSVVEFRFERRIEAFNNAIFEYGIAPVFDLGRGRGMLLATIRSKFARFPEYSEVYVAEMLYETFIPLKERGTWTLASQRLAQAQRAAVPDRMRPGFIWVPSTAGLRVSRLGAKGADHL